MKSILSAVIGATLALSAIEADAQATPGERQVSLTIETDTLASALDKWAQQSGFQIFVQDWEAAKKLSAPSLKGIFTAQGALEQLLSGTPLTYVWINDKAVSIRKKVAQTVPAALQRTSLEGQLSTSVARFVAGDEAAGVSRVRASGLDAEPIGSPGQSPLPIDRSRAEQMEEVLVTGTHIRGVSPESSPLFVYDRRDIDQSGAATVQEFMRQVPQDFGNVDSVGPQGNANSAESSKNFARGSSINLRGLGASGTLVLVNGRRIAPTGDDGSLVDVSLIPLSAVERIEILTDGASAIYGADAVGGVVNFVLRRELDGADTALRYGEATEGGGRELSAAQAVGKSWDGGGILLSYEHFDQEPVRADQRDFVTPLGGTAGASSNVIPSNTRDSALLTLRHQPLDSFGLFSDFFYSQREFDAFLTDGVVTTDSTGGNRSYGGTLGATQMLGSDWQVELSGSYSHTKSDLSQRVTIVGEPFPFDPIASKASISTLDVKADGGTFDIAGGSVRLSIGAQYRRERFDDIRALASAGTGLSRNVSSIFGEMFVPVIGAANPAAFAKRLELSLAGRYDRYDDVGSSTNPKVGLLWSPIDGWNLRGTYAESFRVPPLAQLSPGGVNYTVFPLPDPENVNGETNTVIVSAPGNPILQPETSESYTVGIDIRPHSAPSLAISATYFNIRYEDRIAIPPNTGSAFLIHMQRDALAPFLNYSPSPAELAEIYAHPDLFNPLNIPASEVGAVYDGRLHNIGVSNTDGIDLTATYEVALSKSQLTWSFSASKVLSLDLQAAPTTAVVSAFDEVFFPADLKLRSGVSWTKGEFTSALSVNHTSSYRNTLVQPATNVSSWTTVDLQFQYAVTSATSSLLRGLTFTLNVQNVADRDPPSLDVPPDSLSFLGYDPANATARGRFVSLIATKRW